MEKTGTNWAQTRITIATAAMQSLLANPKELERLNDYFELNQINPYEGIAIEARCYADELIENLRLHPMDGEKLDAGQIALAKNIRVEDLPISVRTFNALHLKGIDTLDKLIRCTSPFLMRYCRNFGKKSLGEIEDCLKERGYRLGMLPPYWIECPHRALTEAHLSDLSDWKYYYDYEELCRFITESNKKILG